MVWSCSVTGKTNLTYEEAVESERKAKKRLGTLPKPLKRGLLWLADHTQRGKLSDMVDDVWRFASGRYFREEIVEAIVNDQWCDCKVINVIPPSQQEIDKDAEEEREEQLKEESESPSKSKKSKKSFFPPEHLFKYELEEIEPDEDLAAVSVHLIILHMRNQFFTFIYFLKRLAKFFLVILDSYNRCGRHAERKRHLHQGKESTISKKCHRNGEEWQLCH